MKNFLKREAYYKANRGIGKNEQIVRHSAKQEFLKDLAVIIWATGFV
jgi:hypothetical protein